MSNRLTAMKAHARREAKRQEAAVGVAKLNAILHGIPMITHYIGLEALNAQILALKLVSGTTGLGPITEFARELAHQINETVTSVNKEALLLTRHYKNLRRKEHLIKHLDLAQAKIQEGNIPPCLILQTKKTTNAHKDETRLATIKQTEIRNLLSELENATNATLVVARNIRIEAAMLQEFRESILSVADILENASQKIRDHVKTCNELITKIA